MRFLLNVYLQDMPEVDSDEDDDESDEEDEETPKKASL